MYPGEVTRIVVRWAPQDALVTGAGAPAAGINLYPFDPTVLAGATGRVGYVWHCHILDHEDNEMMRPYIPTKKPDNTYAKIGGEIPGIIEPLLLIGP